MTRDEILSMRAGRELDELVDNIIMENDGTIICGQYGNLLGNRTNIPCDQILGKYKFHGKCQKCGWIGQISKPLPNYSTDISAALVIVEKLQSDGILIRIDTMLHDFVVTAFTDCGEEIVQIRSKSTPEAICKASLLAVMEVEK
jgi:hypothetical protein